MTNLDTDLVLQLLPEGYKSLAVEELADKAVYHEGHLDLDPDDFVEFLAVYTVLFAQAQGVESEAFQAFWRVASDSLGLKLLFAATLKVLEARAAELS